MGAVENEDVRAFLGDEALHPATSGLPEGVASGPPVFPQGRRPPLPCLVPRSQEARGETAVKWAMELGEALRLLARGAARTSWVHARH